MKVLERIEKKGTDYTDFTVVVDNCFNPCQSVYSVPEYPIYNKVYYFFISLACSIYLSMSIAW